MRRHPTKRRRTKTPLPAWAVLLVALLIYGLNLWEDSEPSEDRPSADATFPTSALCRKVIDGDTVIVSIKGREEKVRLIGIDTMDAYNDEKRKKQASYHRVSEAAIRNLSSLASREVNKMIEDKKVELFVDPESGDRDRYGRLLRYVHVDGTDVGEYLLSQGLAETRREPHARQKHYLRVAEPLAL